MKYLKRFNENSNNDYYAECNIDIFNGIVEKSITIPQNIYDKLRVLTMPNYNIDLEQNSTLICIYGHDYNGFISYVEDEWFYVSIIEKDSNEDRMRYKCDGLEGLLKLLKDKNIII